MRVFYSGSFMDCFQETRVALTGAADPLKLVPDDLLQHAMESCLERWGSSVRTERQSRSFPELTMHTPSGCVILLSTMMNSTVQSLCGDKVLLQDLHFRIYIKLALALSPRKGTATPSAAGAKKTVAAPSASVICSYHVLAHFGIKNENGKLVVCTRGAACPKEHCNVSALAKADISTALKWLPENLRDAALKKMRAKARDEGGCTPRSQPQEKQLNPGRCGAAPSAGEDAGRDEECRKRSHLKLPHVQKPSEEETCRDTSTFQTSDGTEVAMAQGTMLAHMQASVGILSRMRSDKVRPHANTC